MKSGYLNIDDFYLSWRFNNENFSMLTDDEKKRFLPLWEDKASEIWSNIISDKYNHFMLIKQNKNINLQKFCDDCLWGSDNESEIKKLLQKETSLLPNTKTFVFWGKVTAVEADWGLFLEHWSDFCYPSDDGIIVLDGKFRVILIYIEDKLYKLVK